MPLLVLPDLDLALEPGDAVSVSGGGTARLWARLAGVAGVPDSVPAPILYKGEDIAAWAPARRRAAGLLALFPRPQAPAGLTLPQLLRAAAGQTTLRALRRTLRAQAEVLAIPEELLDAPLDDARWQPFGAQAEWLQAAVLKPALAVCAAPAGPGALTVAAALRRAGAAVILAGGGEVPDDARPWVLP
jgi:Fe-S cluster assembly ATPase SufC